MSAGDEIQSELIALVEENNDLESCRRSWEENQSQQRSQEVT